MPQPVDLAFALGLEPRAAIEYFRSKGYAITFAWDSIAADAHARAFTVAKVMRMDVLTSVREELDRALASGLTLAQFRTNLEPRLNALGWWGKQVIERPDGTGQIVNVSSPHRLQTIYRTNLQSSYMAGRYRDFIENTRSRPYWQYVAVMDERTRPAHAALNGRVFRFDDPIWKSCWPPNGYNCRCRVRALTTQDMETKDLAASESGDNLRTFEDADPQTGEVFERVSYKAPGMGQAFSPDRGFAANQALAASVSDVAAAPKSEILGAGRDAALKEIALENWGAWTKWVDDVFDDGVARGRTRVMGYAQDPERRFLEANRMSLSTGALELDDRLLVGRKAARYEEGAVALGPNDWKVLPLQFPDRDAVLFDEKNATLIYVLSTPDSDIVMRIAVKPGSIGRRRKVFHDAVRSAQRMRRADLAGAVKGGLYRLVAGKL
jgi:SPP1 gp7 family putative phage head morphogenesis protein